MADNIQHSRTTSHQSGEAESPAAEPPSTVLTVVATIIMGALLVIVIAGLPPRLGLLGVLSTRILAGIVFLVVLVWYTRQRYYLVQTTSHQETHVWRLPDRQVGILQRSAGRGGGLLSPEIAGSAQAQAFTFAIISPANVRQRITERYEPSQRTMRQEVTIDAQLPQRLVRQILGNSSGEQVAEQPTGSISKAAAAAHNLASTTTSQPAVEESQPSTKSPPASDCTDQKSEPRKQSPARPPVVLFPVLVPRKGAMVDNLRVMAGDGSALPVLSYRQYLQLVARVLRTLLDIAYGTDINENSHPKAFLAEHSALSAVLQRADGNIADETGSQALSELSLNGTQMTNKAAANLAAQLAKKLTSHYAIVAAVPCPDDGRFVISYERLITPVLALTPRPHWFGNRGSTPQPRFSGSLRWLKARLRLLFGARPVDVSIALDNAWTTQSYHLFVDGQDGVFVGAQESPGLVQYLGVHWQRIETAREKLVTALKERVNNGGSVSQTAFDAPPPPYYRFRRRAGQRYGHFYARFFPEPVKNLEHGSDIPKVRFRFFEVPPGSVFRAAVTAVASALLVWLIGFVSSRTPDPGTDVPAFLLVFPAVAAAWLGFESSSRRLLEGTLAARLSLLVTVLISIAASGLFMIYKAGLPYLHWQNPYQMRVLGIHSLAWSALTLVATLNSSSVGYMYLARTWEFIHLSGRLDNFEHMVEHDG